MKLQPNQKDHLREEGWVHLPNVVPKDKIEAAMHRINGWMGRGISPDKLASYRSQSFCPEFRTHPDFVCLLEDTSAISLTESALGKGAVVRGHQAQIALRFPLDDRPRRSPEPHLDGMHTPDNGVESGEIHNFAALIGIYLQDVMAPWSGNFTVWPGSHLRHGEYFQTYGAEALLQGMPPLDIGEPKQLIGRAGDAFLCHYLLGHAAAENHSPWIRYAVFFRLEHADHHQLGLAPMRDPWRGWAGM